MFSSYKVRFLYTSEDLYPGQYHHYFFELNDPEVSIGQHKELVYNPKEVTNENLS